MLYVAYGSNTNLEQMKRRCPFSKIVGTGVLENWKLVFNVHADVIKKEGSFVPVLVWDINDYDWSALDIYEGFPKYYVREIVEVKLDNGTVVHAIIYVMNKTRKGICPPYQYYFETCYDGYEENKMDTEVLYNALEYSWKNQTKRNQYS